MGRVSFGCVCLLLLALFDLGIIGCTSRSTERAKLLVFAATSLADVLADIERAFEQQSDVAVTFSFGGSKALAQQIATGAPADLFIPAGEPPMRFLAAKGLAEPDAKALLTNKLVLVTRAKNAGLKSLEQLKTDAVERIAIADPDLAPAGVYARESLVHFGLWEELQPKLVFGLDVRVALTYVESGNADVAIVYQTDAATATDVEVLDIVPLGSYSPIVYPVVAIRTSGEKAAAVEFTQFLRSAAATASFRRHGFEPLTP